MTFNNDKIYAHDFSFFFIHVVSVFMLSLCILKKINASRQIYDHDQSITNSFFYHKKIGNHHQQQQIKII